MAESTFRSVKIRITTLKRLRKVVEALMVVGWRGVGADRKDAPTLASAVDQGIALLEERVAKAQKEST